MPLLTLTFLSAYGPIPGRYELEAIACFSSIRYDHKAIQLSSCLLDARTGGDVASSLRFLRG